MYDIRPLQLHILDNLLAVDAVCRAHGLRYYIVDGTMLGAVRHGGFIPWDDDIDIGMPRPDYEALCSNCREWLPEPYELVSGHNDPRFPFPFAKIQDAHTTLVEHFSLYYLGGVYIDVFPLDGVPAGALARRWSFARYKFYSRLFYFHYRDPYKHGHGPSSWPTLLARRYFTLAGLHESSTRLMSACPYDSSAYVAEYFEGLHAAMPREVFGDPTPIEFEGHRLMGVAKPHEFLTHIYGPHYMTPPPPDKRHQHAFELLDLHTPYRQYDLRHAKTNIIPKP